MQLHATRTYLNIKNMRRNRKKLKTTSVIILLIWIFLQIFSHQIMFLNWSNSCQGIKEAITGKDSTRKILRCTWLNSRRSRVEVNCTPSYSRRSRVKVHCIPEREREGAPNSTLEDLERAALHSPSNLLKSTQRSGLHPTLE